MAAGETFQIISKVSPKKATIKDVSYRTSDPNIATVSSKGLLTGKSAGNCNITVSTKDGTGKKAVLAVTVKSGSADGGDKRPSDDTSPKETKTIGPDDFATLSADHTECNTYQHDKFIFYIHTSLVADDMTITGPDGKTIRLNDKGEEEDRKAGDGKYTGFINIYEKEENLPGFPFRGIVKVGNETLKTNELRISFIDKFEDSDLEVIEDVDSHLMDAMSDPDYDKQSVADKKETVLAAFEDLLKNQKITGAPVYNEASYSFGFKYNVGVGAGIPGKVLIHEEESRREAGAEKTDTRSILKEKSAMSQEETDADGKKNVVILHNFDLSDCSATEQSWVQYYDKLTDNALGSISNIEKKYNATVEDYKKLQNYDVMVIDSHGVYDRNEKDPELCLREKATSELDQKYENDIKMNRVDRVVQKKGTYYRLRPRFFPFYYQNSKLNDGIVWIAACVNYGECSETDPDMAEAWHSAGADAVYAYLNEVDAGYDFRLYKSVMTSLASGTSTGEALKKAKEEHGNDDGYRPDPAVMYLHGNQDKHLVK